MNKWIVVAISIVLCGTSFAADYEAYWTAVPAPAGVTSITYDVRIDNIVRATGITGTTWPFVDNTVGVTHSLSVRAVPHGNPGYVTSSWSPDHLYTTDLINLTPPTGVGVRKRVVP